MIGILLSLPSIFILFLFKDKYTLGKKSESYSPRLSSPLINVEDLEDEQCENVDGEGCNVNKLAFGQHEFANKHTIPSSVSKMRYIPYILAIADVISGISAGMTVKFFPLFFADELKLSPTYTNGIYVALPILMSIMARGGQIVANKFLGRICTVIVMSSGGALALIALWAIQRFLPNTIPTYAKIVIYVLSTLQHCVRPLKKSL